MLNSAEATRGAVVSTVEATGRLEAVTTVQVGSQVSGSIKALYVDFNSTVRQGQIIAELDPSLFETQVEQAEATVARLEAEVERSRIQAADAQLKLRRARFAHHVDHIREVADESALALVSTEDAVLRYEYGRAVPGLVAVLRHPADGIIEES